MPKHVCDNVEIQKCSPYPQKVPRQVGHKIPRNSCQPISGGGPGGGPGGYELVGVVPGGGGGSCGGGYGCGKR